MERQELLCRMAMTQLLPQASDKQRMLIEELGSATAVYERRHELRDILSRSAWRVADALAAMDRVLPRCEAELDYAHNHKIRILAHGDADYPARLAGIEDPPQVLYVLGGGDLDARHVVSVVGTRRCTDHGRELCRRFAADLRRLLPSVVIVSGLAYGIDIAAHRGSLAAGIPTFGVLAHGLDQIYPRMHRDTAVEMLSAGGLVTEYMSHTPPDKIHFVQRNRIVAALADAVVVVESQDRGGSLITASLASDYSREVFAFPGRPSDACSAGCNALIRSNRAGLITSAADLVESMQWQDEQQGIAQGRQRELFPDLSDDQRAVLEVLRGAEDVTLTTLCERLRWPVAKATSTLFALELKGLVAVLPGGRYRAK